MKMRTPLTFITLLLIFATAFGQEGEQRQDRKEQIAAQKVAFITNKMQLTPDEAKVFWPVYDQYDNQLHELRESHRANVRSKARDLDALSDAEIETLIDKEIEIREKELEVRKKMHVELKKSVGPRKVAMLYKAEKDFQRELLHRYKQGKHDQERKQKEEKRSP